MERLLAALVFSSAVMSAQAKASVFSSGTGGKSQTKIVAAWPKVVEVEGVGENEDQAVKDASLKAIQQVTGFTIDAHQEMVNDELATDRIVATSKGRVTSYTVLGKKVSKGLMFVKIRAKVDRALPKKEPMATCPSCNGSRCVKIDIICTKCRGCGVLPLAWKRGIGGWVKSGGGECPMCRGVGTVQRSKNCGRCCGKGKVPSATVMPQAHAMESMQDEDGGLGGSSQ